METPQTHTYAAGTVKYYRNATRCTDHVTTENLTCHNINIILYYRCQYFVLIFFKILCLNVE
jgi:hypothetical protein